MTTELALSPPVQRHDLRDMIETHHRLEHESEVSQAALYQHVWHWTRDPENPLKLSDAHYARAVGRDRSIISRCARAYEIMLGMWEKRGPMVPRPSEAYELSRKWRKRQDPLHAVADRPRVSASTARQSYGDEVRSEEARASIADDIESDFEEQAKASDIEAKVFRPLGQITKWLSKHPEEVAAHGEELRRRLRPLYGYVEIE
jgi:hypothetical protein